MITILAILGVIALIGVFLWSTYNSLIVAKTRVAEAWSGIDVQLKRRTSLIPNLIETVKGYAKYEKEVFENVTKARSLMMEAKTVDDKSKADTNLMSAVKSLFAVAENYPQLKASESFTKLQDELSDTENKIAYARQFYNSSVLEYNTKLQVIPTVIFAKALNFGEAEFFKAGEDEKKEVEVKL